MEYTKGKWTTEELLDRWAIKAEKYVIVSVYKDANNPDEAKANARLIAAAPDIYEALKGILPELKTYVEEVGDCDHSVGICFCGLFNKIDNLEQALAKAEGGK